MSCLSSLITPREKRQRGGQVRVEDLHEAVLRGENGPGQLVHRLVLVQELPLDPEAVRRPDVVGDQPVTEVLEHLLTERGEGHRLEQVEEVLLQHAQVVVDDGTAVDVEGQGVHLALSAQLQPPSSAKLLRQCINSSHQIHLSHPEQGDE